MRHLEEDRLRHTQQAYGHSLPALLPLRKRLDSEYDKFSVDGVQTDIRAEFMADQSRQLEAAWQENTESRMNFASFGITSRCELERGQGTSHDRALAAWILL